MADDGDFFSQLGKFFGGGFGGQQGQQPTDGQQQPAPQAPNPYGLSDDIRRQAVAQSIGNVGAVLLSAAQPQSRDQRAQTIGKLAEAANPQPYLNNAQQMMMRNLQMKQAARTINLQELRDKAIQDPAVKAMFKQMTGYELTDSLANAMGPEQIDAILQGAIDPQKRLAMEAVRAKIASEKYKAVPAGGSLFDTTAGTTAYQDTSGAFSDEAVDDGARRLLGGDESALHNVGRGAQGGQNIVRIRNRAAEIARAEGIDPTEMSQALARFGGQKAAERTLGTRTGNLELGIAQTKRLMPQAFELVDKLQTGDYPALNRVILEGRKAGGDPTVVEAGLAIKSLVNAYAKAIGGGVLHVAHQQQAQEMLNEYMAKGQIKAGINRMLLELQSEAEAGPEASQALGKLYVPRWVKEKKAAAEGGGATATYKSPDDVKAAVAAKTISRDEGLRILREQFKMD